jgi:DNA-3-methyladenine glycosylase I
MFVSMPRCPWAISEPNATYHDTEWGVPVHDDRTLFEFLILEGAQAGLSWTTILNKRENYRKAFDRFCPEKIARYGPREIKRYSAIPGSCGTG